MDRIGHVTMVVKGALGGSMGEWVVVVGVVAVLRSGVDEKCVEGENLASLL